MTATPSPLLSAERLDRWTPWAFAVTVFVSASLVFVVQPMAAKLVLPLLGGSPSVWNAVMVFFQAALLCGYGYAHLLQRVRSLKLQISLHLTALALAALFLPLGVRLAFGAPSSTVPALWLIGTLTVSLGAPFAALSATAPLLQAWFARVRDGSPDGANPYVLYAASNLGSFLALLAYPILIEPTATLTAQRLGWTAGYAVFLILLAGLGLLIAGRSPDFNAAAASEPIEAGPAIAWKQKARIVLLAAIPSSLMLGVTAHLSTDVASAPFLWVAPLALYLLTFVFAFQAKPAIPYWITAMVAAALLAVSMGLIAFKTGEWTVMLAISLLTFFFVALFCHQTLAAERPQPARLTEFFLLLSVGGVVGGIFNALIAPVIFNTVWEYPLVLILAGLVRPWNWSLLSKRDIYLLVAGVLICATPPLLLELVRYMPDLRAVVSDGKLIVFGQLVLGLGAIIAFLLRDRGVLFTVLLAIAMLSGQRLARGYDWDLSERSFFGVMRVATIQDPGMGGPVHVLMHGTTLHGAQATNPANACLPTLYYAAATPIGQATQRTIADHPGSSIAVVGQGSGALAAYKRFETKMTFFEIDPTVDRLSRDPRWFSYINGCADGPIRTVIGDARLTLAQEPEGAYDLLIIDAFTSDAVPTHLLTQEAIAGYLKRVKPDGVVLLHLSNRNLEITRPTIAAADALGVPILHQIYIEAPDQPEMLEASTEAVILSPTEAGLAPYRQDDRWRAVHEDKVRPWTDDYVDLFGSLIRQTFRR